MKIRESPFKDKARNLEISIAVLEGDTLSSVASIHGITGPRVGVLLNNLILDCNRRYRKAYGKSSNYKPGYLKDLRVQKNELIPFIKKWGAGVSEKDVWELDIPLINKIFWNLPHKKLCHSDVSVMKIFVDNFPEEIYRLLNERLDKLGWQLALGYSPRLFKDELKGGNG